MEIDKILAGMSDEDVISITARSEKTFCVSQFREVWSTAIIRMENAYSESLIAQGYHLSTGFDNGNINCPNYDNWFMSGVDCKQLRLGDRNWRQGKVRIRVEVEFVPDEENSIEIARSSLDEIRNSIN